jgi:hypothetical protein
LNGLDGFEPLKVRNSPRFAYAYARRFDSEKAEFSSRPGATHVQGVKLMAKAKKKATVNAVEILYRRYYAGKPRRLAAFSGAPFNLACTLSPLSSAV